MAVAMSLPFIGWILHWVRHKLGRTVCMRDETCVPKCEHPVVKDDEIYDPLDPG